MIHMKTFTGFTEEECFRKINDEIEDIKVINVYPRGEHRSVGYDEYDVWTTYSVDVIYRD